MNDSELQLHTGAMNSGTSSEKKKNDMQLYKYINETNKKDGNFRIKLSYIAFEYNGTAHTKFPSRTPLL